MISQEKLIWNNKFKPVVRKKFLNDLKYYFSPVTPNLGLNVRVKVTELRNLSSMWLSVLVTLMFNYNQIAEFQNLWMTLVVLTLSWIMFIILNIYDFTLHQHDDKIEEKLTEFNCLSSKSLRKLQADLPILR